MKRYFTLVKGYHFFEVHFYPKLFTKSFNQEEIGDKYGEGLYVSLKNFFKIKNRLTLYVIAIRNNNRSATLVVERGGGRNIPVRLMH